MYTIRIDSDSKIYFSTATILIGIPTRVKVFTWVGNLISHSTPFLHISLLWVGMFIWFFTLRGVTRLVLSNVVSDASLHDRYYVVAHFHYVLSIRATSRVILGSYFFGPIFVGSISTFGPSLKLSLVWSIRVNGIFRPIHTLRKEGIARRYSTYSEIFSGKNKLIRYMTRLTLCATLRLFVNLRFFGYN